MVGGGRLFRSGGGLRGGGTGGLCLNTNDSRKKCVSFYCHNIFDYSPINGGGLAYPGETIFKISYSCDTILCPNSPGRAFRFKHNFFEIF